MMLTAHYIMLSGEVNLAIGQKATYRLKKYNVIPSVLAVDGIYETFESTYAEYYPVLWMVTLEKRYQIQRTVVLGNFDSRRKFLVLTLTGL